MYYGLVESELRYGLPIWVNYNKELLNKRSEHSFCPKPRLQTDTQIDRHSWTDIL